jgi:hypothetical protein
MEKDHGTGSQPESAAAIREQPVAAETATAPRLFSITKIKQLFRAIAKAVITDKAPKPKRRRKREEDTRGLFKKLAMKLLSAAAQAISEPDPWYMPPGELDGTQRLLMRERLSQAAVRQQQHNQAFHYQHPDHLSPRF